MTNCARTDVIWFIRYLHALCICLIHIHKHICIALICLWSYYFWRFNVFLKSLPSSQLTKTWRNIRHWLHRKLSSWQLSVQPVPNFVKIMIFWCQCLCAINIGADFCDILWLSRVENPNLLCYLRFAVYTFKCMPFVGRVYTVISSSDFQSRKNTPKTDLLFALNPSRWESFYNLIKEHSVLCVGIFWKLMNIYILQYSVEWNYLSVPYRFIRMN